MHNQRKNQHKLGKRLPNSKLHSIPISCAFALLLLGVAYINPSSSHVQATTDTTTRATNEDINTGISLTISGNPDEQTPVSTNATTYRSHIVTASASKVKSYSLTISYTDGSTSLKNDATGATIINNVATSGVKGSSMENSTWGWGWSDDANTDSSEITYLPMQIAPAVVKADSKMPDNAAQVNGKLAFAAKFAEGATVGHYRANVLLSFVIEPKAISISDITNMQDITPDICANSEIGETATLTDKRDSKTYTVAKIKNQTNDDANCWMTQNLAIVGQTLTPELTDMTEGEFVLPNQSLEELSLEVAEPIATLASTSNGYYNWYTANAGLNPVAVGAGTTPPATRSICPKGWKLPRYNKENSLYDYQELLQGLSIYDVTHNLYNFTLIGTIVSNSPDAGGKISQSGERVVYWTADARGGTGGYSLDINQSKNIIEYDPIYAYWFGFPIRCIAR